MFYKWMECTVTTLTREAVFSLSVHWTCGLVHAAPPSLLEGGDLVPVNDKVV